MEPQFINLLIFSHASLGGVALLSGLVALLTKKGSKPHRLSGKFFFWSMLFSAAVSMIVSTQKDHENPFLFAIGVFSIYLIASGKLAVSYKNEDRNFTLDTILAILMIVTGGGMIFYPILMFSKLNIVMSVFGILGISLSIQDLVGIKKREKIRENWLQSHIGKMTGGYISAVTAFIVVNEIFPPLISWLGPATIGTIFIFYHIRKVS